MSSANQRTERESWLLHDKHYKDEKCGELAGAFGHLCPGGLHVTDSRSSMESDAMSLEGHAPARKAWPVEVWGLGNRHLKMAQGQPVVWHPSTGPTSLHSVLPGLGQGPQAVKDRRGLRLQLGLGGGVSDPQGDLGKSTGRMRERKPDLCWRKSVNTETSESLPCGEGGSSISAGFPI